MYLEQSEKEGLLRSKLHPSNENRTLLESLVHNYHDVLLGFLKRRLPTTEDAEDMAQETYFRIARKPQGEKIRDPHAFLFKTAVNLLHDERRRVVTNGLDRRVPLDDDRGHASDLPSPERVAGSRQALKVFEGLLEELPPKCRHVFVLHRFQGMTYPEISHQCNISLSAVEKHIMRALVFLNEHMGESR